MFVFNLQISLKGGVDLRAKLQDHVLHFKSGLVEFTQKGTNHWKLDLPSVVCDMPGECEQLWRIDRYCTWFPLEVRLRRNYS